MKTKKTILFGLLATITLLITSCGNFDSLNTDPTRLTSSNPGTFLNPVLYGMATYNWNRYDDYTFPLLQSEVFYFKYNRCRLVFYQRCCRRRYMDKLLPVVE